MQDKASGSWGAGRRWGGIVRGRADNLLACGLLSSLGQMGVAGCPSLPGTRRARGASFGMKICQPWSRRGSEPATSAGSGRPLMTSTRRCCGPGCGWSAATTWRSPRRCCWPGRGGSESPRPWPGRGREGAGLALRGAAGPGLALRGAAAPAAQAARRSAAAGQTVLFEPADPVFPSPRAALDALVAVHAEQVRRIAADEYPARFGLLAAAESAAGLVAAEMGFYGLPWRADVHAALLAGLLGDRPVHGMRPARLADLAGRIAAAFGGRPVNPDSPAQVLRAFANDGVRVPSTRAQVLRGLDHPAAALLLEYKELARLHAAHGWSWLDEWVAGGRFRP